MKSCGCCHVTKCNKAFAAGQRKVDGGVCRDCTRKDEHGGGSHASGSAPLPRSEKEAVAHNGDDAEFENPCPICFENEDDAYVGGHHSGMCNACGNFYCGACNKGGISAAFKNCAMCRAPFRVSNEEQFNRVRKLIFGRSPGRHTHVAQCNLGAMYASGRGVKVDHVESEKCYRLSAEGGFAGAQFTLSSMYAEGQGSVKQDRAEAIKWLLRAANNGHTKAQVNLGGMYFTGTGVARNLREAVMWVQLAAEQGDAGAFFNLRGLQAHNQIPTPPTDTAVTITLLSSAKAAKYNNQSGKVVGGGGDAVKPGRALVLLDEEAVPISFKLMNLRWHPASGVPGADSRPASMMAALALQTAASAMDMMRSFLGM